MSAFNLAAFDSNAFDLESFDLAASLIPIMPVAASPYVAEGNLAVGTFAVLEGSLPITYSLSGVDAASFAINASTGQLDFLAAPVYDVKNNYSIAVTATNSFGSDIQNLTVVIIVITDDVAGVFSDPFVSPFIRPFIPYWRIP